MRRLSVTLPALALALAALSTPAVTPGAGDGGTASAATAECGRHWVSSWYSAPSDATLSQPPVEQTFRIQVKPTRGGDVARFRLSNRFGSGPVTFGHATVGKQDREAGGAAITPGTLHALRFDGSRTVTLARGQEVLSDPVRIHFGAFRTLLVSLHVTGFPGPATQHAISEQTTWQTPQLSGDRTAQLGANGFVAMPVDGLTPSLPQGIPYLMGMDVRASERVGTVVTFGDSITDGTEAEALPFVVSTDNIDTFTSYPEFLARRIQRRDLPFSVANAAISGNMLLSDAVVPVFGAAGLSRLGRDALARSGATTLILLEGINDIGQMAKTRDQMVAGYKKAIAAAHNRGVRVLLGTLTPQNGTLQPPNYGALGEPTRVAVNRWIRNQSLADGIVDFDKAVRDPEDHSRIYPPYDGGDHLHFSAAGHRAMAAAVPLSALRRSRC